MKFNRMVGTALAAVTSMALGLGTVACSRDYTVAYVYAVSASNGTISAYAVDYQSGVLTQITGSPFPTQFTNPTTLVATPNGKFLYVIGGSQNAAVEEIAVGTDGKLYGQHTYSLTNNGSYPTAAVVDSTGSFLYVTFTYQQGFGPVSTGPGGISEFKINSDNSLTAVGTVNVGNNPVAIAASAPTCTTTPATANAGNTACGTGGHTNSFVYVVDQEASPNATVLGFAQNTTSGVLTLLPSSICTGTGTATSCQGNRAGVTPSAMAIDPTARYLYITDKTSNQIVGYQIAYTSTGALTALPSSPFSTGLFPVSITIEPRGKYVYTANYNSNTVSGYSLNSSDGSLGAAAASSFTTATGPTCVSVEPALGIYLYTSNYLDGSVSGGQLSPNTGGVTAIANTPFPSGALPSCVVAVANGEHASSIDNP